MQSGRVPDKRGCAVVTARVSKILIVDDTPHNIDVLSATLGDEHCELMAATSGARALELAARGQPDLVLLDVMMPGMDGFEVCRRLKADPATADIPVIFVTARTDDVSQGFAVGGSDYISKPINADEVRARVRYQLERRNLLEQLRELNQSLEEKVRERTAELTIANRHLRQEINERRYMQDRLNYLATHDFVTRLYNRGALDAHVSELLARVQRAECDAVFLLIDIDQFRLVNETCGCIAGDELLRQFAEVVAGAAGSHRLLRAPGRRQVRRRHRGLRPRRRPGAGAPHPRAARRLRVPLGRAQLQDGRVGRRRAHRARHRLVRPADAHRRRGRLPGQARGPRLDPRPRLVGAGRRGPSRVRQLGAGAGRRARSATSSAPTSSA